MSIIKEPCRKRVKYRPYLACLACETAWLYDYIREHEEAHTPVFRACINYTIRDCDNQTAYFLERIQGSAPRRALSASYEQRKNNSFRNGWLWHTGYLLVTYYDTSEEGDIKLPRPGTCRECGEKHLRRHAKRCPLRGDDRLIYVGKENLT